MSIFIFILSIGPRKEVAPPRVLVYVRNWLTDKVKIELETARLSINLMAFCFIFIFLVILPFLFWVVGAHTTGKLQFQREVCKTRNAKILPSLINLGDGTKLTGVFLERSENLSVLMDRDAIYVITIGEKSILQDATSVRNVKCPTS
jgi:hypothetical protein